MNNITRVLQFSTHNEECGIAKYQEQFTSVFSNIEDIYSEYFKFSPNIIKSMDEAGQNRILVELKEQLKEFDILHIQHELSFFKSDELSKIINIARRMNVKTVATIHTAPAAQYIAPRLTGVGPRSIIHFVKSVILSRRFMGRYYTPLKDIDLIIVHNNSTKQDLISHGFDSNKIKTIRHPVPMVESTQQSQEISKVLRKTKEDIIFATVGFMSRSKGILHAVKALPLLPDNYKLAIIGGMHPDTDDVSFYDEVSDTIEELELQSRVYITGFIKEDARLHALIREVDICVYPYDKKYYSFVSSGSLNSALANHKPVISYATASFVEINHEMPVVTFCKSPNYYELAREIRTVDIKHSSLLSKKYADKFSWDIEATAFASIYRQLADGQ